MKLVMAIALLASLGCEKPQEGPAPDPIPAPSHDGVQLLSLGSEGKRVLTYRLRKGTRTAMEMAMTMDLDAGRSMKMPTIVMTVEIAVEDVLPGGAAKVKTRVIETKVLDRPGATLDAAALQPVTQAITGLGYTFTLSPEGSLSDGKVIGTAPGDLQAQLGQMTRAIEQVAMRLPPVPVGVGARWSAKKTVHQNGIELTTVTTTQLTAIDGDTFSFTSQTTLAAPNQQLVQQGMTMDIKDLGGGGTGKGRIDLTTMAMRGDLTSEFRGTLTGTMSAAGQATPMNVTMQLTLK